MISAPKPPNAFQYAWRSPWVRLVVFGLLAAAAYRFTGLISSILVNFAIAYLIAYIANPMLNWLERGRVPRGLGVLFVLLLFGGLLTVAGLLLGTIASQLIDLLRQLPQLVQNLEGWADSWIQWLSARGVTGLEDARAGMTETVQTYIRNLGDNLVPMLQRWLDPQGALLTSIATIGSVLGRLLIVMLMSVYLMLDYSRVNRAMLKMFPRPWQPRVLEFADLAGTAIGGYVRGQLLIALFVGTVVALGLSLLGIPSALAIGFLAGAFNIIPYLGPIIGAIPAILLAAPMGITKVLLAVGVFLVANQVEGSFLSPIVLSKTTDLHPITVLLSILIGASVLGFAGALIAVPLVALGKLAVEKYYYSSKIYTEGP
ncbi:AI-2E family transporter [Deinococcus sp. SL84]|uniref:AI-2E family transporter n=1 Tax=Deinococcus sp. SL84 TaxID=2994663 RepID=UPI002275824B|nr:AI-2E family transporter [Deinococcus sp. SL84]MCY1702564.1 AI-2E family transporter [Deinococcus sp. SL84]